MRCFADSGRPSFVSQLVMSVFTLLFLFTCCIASLTRGAPNQRADNSLSAISSGLTSSSDSESPEPTSCGALVPGRLAGGGIIPGMFNRVPCTLNTQPTSASAAPAPTVPAGSHGKTPGDGEAFNMNPAASSCPPPVTVTLPPVTLAPVSITETVTVTVGQAPVQTAGGSGPFLSASNPSVGAGPIGTGAAPSVGTIGTGNVPSPSLVQAVGSVVPSGPAPAAASATNFAGSTTPSSETSAQGPAPSPFDISGACSSDNTVTQNVNTYVSLDIRGSCIVMLPFLFDGY